MGGLLLAIYAGFGLPAAGMVAGAIAREALLSGLLVVGPDAEQYVCECTLFWQLPQPWLGEPFNACYPQHLVITDGKRQPRRRHQCAAASAARS